MSHQKLYKAQSNQLSSVQPVAVVPQNIYSRPVHHLSSNFMVDKYLRSMVNSPPEVRERPRRNSDPAQRKLSTQTSSGIFIASDYDKMTKQSPAMGEGGNDDFEELLTCMICFDSYTNPKMLTCGHTFCEDCLAGYNNSYIQQRKHVPGQLPCPTCREYTPLPKVGISGLKNDFKIEKIKKMEDMFRTVSKRGKFCDSCKAERRTTKSQFFCSDCSMKYCKSCAEKHNRSPVLSGHNIVSDPDKNGEICQTHSPEEVKFLCKTCKTVVCVVCTIHDHEGHEFVELNKIFRDNQEKIKNLKETILSKLSEMKSKRKDIDSLREKHLSAFNSVEKLVKSCVEKSIYQVKKCQEALMKELAIKKDEKLASIEQFKENLDYIIAESHGLEGFVSSAMETSTSVRAIAMFEDLIERMKTISKTEINQEDTSPYRYLSFAESSVPVSLGEIRETDNPPKIIRPAPSRQISNERGGKPTLVFKIDKQGSNLGELKDPLGVTCLGNGGIVVSEWGNERIQVFDPNGKHVAVIGTGLIQPQDVSCTRKGNILVSDAKNKRIEAFSPVGPTGKSISKWGLGKFVQPCGIAVSSNGNCVITDIAECSVSIFESEKKELVRFGKMGSRREDFKNPLYVETSERNYIYVSDSDNHCIKVFDSLGNYQGKIGSKGVGPGQLLYPRGVAFDSDGNLLVADRNNHRVCKFTHNGKFLREILTRYDGINFPYGIAYSSTNRLIITESGENIAALKIFQL